MRLGRTSPRWSVHRIGCAADVSCVIALRLDEDDAPRCEIRMTLNGETFYERMYAEQDHVERDAADALRDLLAAGWRMDAPVASTADASCEGRC